MSEMEQAPPQLHLSSDAAIRGKDEDRFGRHSLANRIAAEAVMAPPDDGFVIALCGPWGSGKTSILNLVEEELEPDPNVTVVRFNPWLFSGAEDLVGRFFGELAATLGRKVGGFHSLAGKVAGYAGALAGLASLAPVVGAPAATLLTTAHHVMGAAGGTPSLHDRQAELIEGLRELDGRIVVLVDDLDRLTDEEIREIVRLVKLIGDLPRLTYVLAFDRERVEAALGAPEIDADRARDRGRAYLEKIIQSRHDVPPLRAETLLDYMIQGINVALEPYGDRHFHEADWANMLGLGLRHMVTTPRDAKRVANALPAALKLHGDEVALVDLVGLEALRILEPDVHAGLASLADVLVEDRLVIGDRERQRQEDRERISELLRKAKRREPTQALLAQLFPRAYQALGGSGRAVTDEGRERRELRVSVAAVFRAYIHHSLDAETLGAAQVESFMGILADPDALRNALKGLSPAELSDVIGRLIDHRDRFDPNHARTAALEFLATEPRLLDESPFKTGRAPGSWKLRWLVGHFFLAETDPARRSNLVLETVNQAPTFSIRHLLISWFGTHPERDRPDPDSEMLDEQTTERLLEQLREDLVEAPPRQLAGEPELIWLLEELLQPDANVGRLNVQQKAHDDGVMLKLLRSAFGYRQAHTVGEAAVRRIPRLDWETLTRLLGEEHLRGRVMELGETVNRATLDVHTAGALDTALRIARGEMKPPNESDAWDED